MLQACDRIDRFPSLRLLSTQRYSSKAKQIDKRVSGVLIRIGVRAGGARGAAAPPKFGQLRFFGQREEIWAKPVFKGSLHVHLIILKS